MNIRSLNKNFDLLEQHINHSLKAKPSIIVCSESCNLKYPEFYNINGYQLYYNDSKINIADGVVMYINNNIQHNVKISEYDNCKILTAKLKLNSPQIKMKLKKLLWNFRIKWVV